MKGALNLLIILAMCAGTAWADTVSISAGGDSTTAIQTAIDGASEARTIVLQAGTHAVSSQVNVNRQDITIQGEDPANTLVQVSGTGYRFSIAAAGAVIENLTLEKTDKTGVQNLIYIGASNATIRGNVIFGRYVMGDPEVSRALEVTYGISGLTIEENEIYALRQPAYINGSLASPTTGNITSNYVHGTRGWVIAGANMTFSGNTWGSGADTNYLDIAILAGTDPSYYTDIPALSAAHHGAVFEDQRVSPATLTTVYVDANAAPGGDGTVTKPYQTITPAVARVMTGGTILVAAGTYNETVSVSKSVSFVGAGCGQTIWRGSAITSHSLKIVRDNTSPADVHVAITGFSFETENNQTIRGDWSTSYAEALTLDIHDNCFAHVNTRNPGTDFALYVNGANQTARDTEGAIRVYNNQFDVVTGGVLFEYCRAVDLLDNDFRVTFEGVIFNYYGNSGACGEQLVKGNVFTHVPVEWALAMNNWHGTGNYTVLPSAVTNNEITATGFSYAILYGVAASQSQAHDFTIQDNALLSGTVFVWGDYASQILLNASGNWWGSIASPAGRINTAGSVDYTPWLGGGDDTSTDPGFQGNFSTLWASAASPQTGTTGRIQEAINSVDGSTVNVLPGTYAERLTINKSLNLYGPQKDVDPTASGARTNSANEAIVTCAGLSTPNPDVLIEIPTGVTGVVIDGLTLQGHPTNPVADTSIVRCWGSDLTVSNNIMDGWYAVIFKGGNNLTVSDNRVTVNKVGVACQPGTSTEITLAGNTFVPGTSSAADSQAAYMTAVTHMTLTDNVASGFGGSAVAGSNLSNVLIEGNVLTNCRDGVSFWGSTYDVVIRENELSEHTRYGINFKGQNLDVLDNRIADNGNTGINVERHVIDTLNIHVHGNEIFGNASFGLKAAANITGVVDAENNWWGHASGPYDPDGSVEADINNCADPAVIKNPNGLGDLVSDVQVDYCPWLLGPTAPNALYLVPTSESIYIKPGESAIVDMNVANLLQKVNACQAMLGYSSTYFEDPTAGTVGLPASGPWDQLIWDSWLNSSGAPGEIDTAIGVNAAGTVGTDADGKVCKITLTARAGVQGITQIVFRPDADPDPGLVASTYLSDMLGNPVWPTKFDSIGIVIDDTDPAVAALTATQDQGAGAVDVLNCAATTLQGTVAISVGASDALAGIEAEPVVTVTQGGDALTVTYAGESPAGTFNYTVDIEPDAANGTWTIEATATDKAGNDASVSGTLCVDKNQITGQVELESLVGGLTRTVTFVATGGVKKTWDIPVVFPADSAVGTFTLTEVPDGTTALSAKTNWNLRRKVDCSLDGDGQASADFIGTAKLRGGDINGSNSINILDYSVMKISWMATTAGDINGDGATAMLDYSIMKSNWFVVGDAE